MNRYIILIIILIIVALVLLFGLGPYSLFDTAYLFGWGASKPFPEEIRQKHIATIEKVDELIKKENIDSVTSRSKKFNLENYLKIIEIGVLPDLNKKYPNDDSFIQDVKLLIEDIRKYINKDRKYLINK